MNLLQQNVKKIHCIGIGGIGVSGLAEILLNRGYEVSGSDANQTPVTERLASLGICVWHEHAQAHVADCDLVVFSSAITEDNPELLAARQQGITCIRRGELLAELMSLFSHSVAVAGTHGKTTTTALLAHILMTAKLQPNCVIGGVIAGYESPIHIGSSDYFVAEADESDASFLHMRPEVAIINNIEADHMETYQGDFDRLKQGFLQFANDVNESGVVVLGLDDAVIKTIAPQITRKTITVGFDQQADYCIADFKQRGLESHFTVSHAGEKCAVILNLVGRHNALNALAAMAVAQYYGIALSTIIVALATFPGVGRRLQAHAPIQLPEGQAAVFEDYGHHPTEVSATLQAAHEAWPEQRVVLVFQPHRYSRTRDLLDQFAAALAKADTLVLTDIYAADEAPIAGVSSQVLADQIEQQHSTTVHYVQDLQALPAALQAILQPNDVVLFQGAGSIGRIASSIGEAHAT